MWFELLNFIMGIAFGFFHRGKEDLAGILRNGAIAGIILGVFGIFVEIIIFVLIFIVGAFIGDWLEGFKKRT